MSNDGPKRDTMSLEEATVSNMWEIAAIVEVLERKGTIQRGKTIVSRERLTGLLNS